MVSSLNKKCISSYGINRTRQQKETLPTASRIQAEFVNQQSGVKSGGIVGRGASRELPGEGTKVKREKISCCLIEDRDCLDLV